MQGFRELIQLHLAHEVERTAAVKQADIRQRVADLEANLASAKAGLDAAEAEVKRLHLERKSFKPDGAELNELGEGWASPIGINAERMTHVLPNLFAEYLSDKNGR